MSVVRPELVATAMHRYLRKTRWQNRSVIEIYRASNPLAAQ